MKLVHGPGAGDVEHAPVHLVGVVGVIHVRDDHSVELQPLRIWAEVVMMPA